MNFSRNLGIFCLVIITVLYVYFAFFNGKEFEGFNFHRNNEISAEKTIDESLDNSENTEEISQKSEIKKIKIFVTDKNGNLRSVNRNCDISTEKSCFNFAIKELLSAPTKWEKSKGLSSEIPQDTKILSIRENDKNVLID